MHRRGLSSRLLLLAGLAGGCAESQTAPTPFAPVSFTLVSVDDKGLPANLPLGFWSGYAGPVKVLARRIDLFRPDSLYFFGLTESHETSPTFSRLEFCARRGYIRVGNAIIMTPVPAPVGHAPSARDTLISDGVGLIQTQRDVQAPVEFEGTHTFRYVQLQAAAPAPPLCLVR